MSLPARAADVYWSNPEPGAHEWLDGNNWANLYFAGDVNGTNLANSDLANFEGASDHGVTITINFAATSGTLALGAIEHVSYHTPSPLSQTTIRPLDTSVASRVLLLNGADILGVPNTIVACEAQAYVLNLGNAATPFSEVRLGNTANVIQLASGRILTTGGGTGGIITEANAGSGITLTSYGGWDVASIGQFSARGANTFSGPVRIERNMRWAAGLNAQGLGLSSPAAANLVLDNGTVQVNSTTAHSAARLFTLGPGGGAIQVAGAGEFSLTSSGDIAFEGAGARTLTLGREVAPGNRTANFAPRLTDAPEGATSLRVEGDPANTSSTLVWKLSNAHTYSGQTTVGIRATLALVGSSSIGHSPTISLAATTARFDVSGVTGGANFDGNRFALASGQTLDGIGTVIGAMSVRGGATLSPGLGLGALSVSSLHFTDAQATLAAEIDLAGTFGADLVNVTGVVELGGASLDLSLLNAPATAGSPLTFLLINNDGSDSIANTFGELNLSSLSSGGFAYVVNYAFSGTDALGRIGDGNDLAVTLTAVPEPSSLAMFVLALSVILNRRLQKAKLAC